MEFSWMEKLKSALKTQEVVYLVNKPNESSGLLGLVKCLNLEPTEKASVKCILIKDHFDSKFFHSDVVKQQLAKGLTINVLNKGVWGSYRHIPINGINEIDVSSACNFIQTIGDLSSFKWVERPKECFMYSSKSEEVFVHYSALNFRDVLVATGKISFMSTHPTGLETQAGIEYSGVTKSGKRVMGLSNECIALQVSSDPLFTWEVPSTWTLADGATVPVVYATCYYGMIIRGQLERGESILIHAGAGGVGIAAISIALSMNCEIFTTVGSQEKKDFLMKHFPTLKPENIGNSRNSSFEQLILKNTKGRGVDVVLNSLAADLFQASIRCIARRGRFLEIGKIDLLAGTPVSASLFIKNTSFHGVLLDDLFGVENESPIKEKINRLVKEGVQNGVVRPLPRTVFAEDQAEDAYRFVSTGKHKGKVLIKIRDETVKQTPRRTIKALPRIYFNSEKTYILIGGLGGFGLELTHFLIKRCAKKIILNSRRGLSNGYQALCMKRWAQMGVAVKINTSDTSTLEGTKELLEFAEKLGPVGGIFNMALTLEDALFLNQTPEKFQAALKSKIYSGMHLDQLSRLHCPKIDHFVVFSSITSGWGNPGQSNYGMANSALERLCEKRREEGFPGLAVQYGPVGEVGIVAEKLQFEKNINALGLKMQNIASCINALETFMLQPYIIGSTFVLHQQSSSSSSSAKTPQETVAHILGIKDIELIDNNQSLAEMGMDSLMTTEIKQTLYRNFNIEIDVEQIRELTFKKLAEMTEHQETTTQGQEAPKDLHVNDMNGHHLAPINAMLAEEVLVEVINDKQLPNKIFFIPPIEGHTEVMLPLARRLKANVYGLQFTKDIDFKNITDMALYFVKVIRKVQPKGLYNLCGYSYGGALGFEIGVQLEKLGGKVKLFLLDGAPSFITKILLLKYNQDGKKEVKSRISSLKAFIQTFEEIDQEKADSIFDVSISYEEQLNRIGDFVTNYVSYNAKDIATSADRYFKRMSAGFFYEPTNTFKGEATLIRSDDVMKDLPTDYDLQKVCETPISLVTLRGNHRQILLGDNLKRIVEIINGRL